MPFRTEPETKTASHVRRSVRRSPAAAAPASRTLGVQRRSPAPELPRRSSPRRAAHVAPHGTSQLLVRRVNYATALRYSLILISNPSPQSRRALRARWKFKGEGPGSDDTGRRGWWWGVGATSGAR